MRTSIILGLSILLAGCEKAEPMLAHGKPLEHWLQAARDSNAAVRKKAVKVLGNVGPVDPAIVPALSEALQDRDAEVRREAVLALSKAGPAAREAIPLLTTAQKDMDPAVRSSARQALVRIRGIN
jgi:HEAT repeat protein